MLDLRRGIGALGLVSALSAGSHVWSRALGEPGPRLEVRIRSVAGQSKSGALVAGSVVGKLDPRLAASSSPGSGERDLFVTLLAGDGTPRQSLLLGGSGLRELASASFDPGGNVILAGRFTGTLDLDGMHLATPAGGGSSGFVARLDPSGHPLWLKQLSVGPITQLTIHGAAGDARGGVVLIGYVDGRELSVDGAPLDVSSKFALRLDASGQVAWSRRLRYGVADTLPPVIDPSGNTVIAFVSESLEKIHLVKLDPEGNQRWREQLGGGITQELTGLAVDSTGAILLTAAAGSATRRPRASSASSPGSIPRGTSTPCGAVRRCSTPAWRPSITIA